MVNPVSAAPKVKVGNTTSDTNSKVLGLPSTTFVFERSSTRDQGGAPHRCGHCLWVWQCRGLRKSSCAVEHIAVSIARIRQQLAEHESRSRHSTHAQQMSALVPFRMASSDLHSSVQRIISVKCKVGDGGPANLKLMDITHSRGCRLSCNTHRSNSHDAPSCSCSKPPGAPPSEAPMAPQILVDQKAGATYFRIAPRRREE